MSDRRYEEQIDNECPEIDALIRGPERTMNDLIAEAAGDFLLTKIGLEATEISWATVSKFQETLPNISFEETTGIVESLRQIKEPDEVEKIRTAVRIAEQTVGVIRSTLKLGQTEQEIAFKIEEWIRFFGGEGCGFAPIVALGPNAALPHAQPGTQQIGDDPSLLIDWGARFEGYTSDLTRMTVIDKPSDVIQEIYPVVLDAQLAAIEAIRPGVELRAVDAAARDVIAAAGYGEYFGHGLGHGIGLQIHEAPRMSSIQEGTVKEGMIVTVEPGIYLPGKLGVRIEDDVLVTSGGYEVLSSLPKGLDDCRVIL